MPGELLYIVDDTSNAIALGGGQWATSEASRWYNGSTLYPGFALTEGTDTGVFGSLNYTFHGTSIAFVGNTHRSNNSRITLVTIDSNSPYNTSYDNPNSQNYQQWYQSPHLDDGVHMIQMDNIAATAVDIVVISAGPSTPLSGQTVIVDDDDPSISYLGNWSRNEPFITSEGAGGLPFHNGTHQSTTPGDTASIRFTGTSVAVYGIFPWATLGSMSVTYTIDNSNNTKTYQITPSLLEKEPQLNFQFFSEGSLAPGNHTLSMNITEISNLTFVMDYLTYSASFDSLTTKPNITAPTTPAPSTSPSMLLPTGSSSPTHSKNGLVGGVVGGVAGVVVVLAIALFIIYKRRRRDRAFLSENGLESGRQRLVTKPYLLTVPTTRTDATPGPAATINDAVLPPPPVTGSRDKLKRSLDSSLTTSSPQRPISNPQEDTQQPNRVFEALIAALGIIPGNDRASHDNQIQINQLRQRINELAQGNSHPNPPPAYEAGAS